MDAFADSSGNVRSNLNSCFYTERNSNRRAITDVPVLRRNQHEVSCAREECNDSVLKSGSSTTFLSDRIDSVLRGKKLTLHQVSRLSRSIYGRSSKYFIPHNFYYELRRGAFSPSIYQVAALSHITGYRLRQWLGVFGFNLEEIVRLQAVLPAKRTLLIDSPPGHGESAGAWPSQGNAELTFPRVTPLGQLLRLVKHIPSYPISSTADRLLLYVKIGWEDALAFPDLVPGSIVSITQEPRADLLLQANENSAYLFLVRHSKGLFCCQLRSASTRALVPISNKLPYGQIELRYPGEVTILGKASYEIRPLIHSRHPEVPADLARRWRPAVLKPPAGLGQLLRSRRQNLHMSLQDASLVSRRVADEFSDTRYFISTSSLSDYEASDTPPRHLHKIMSFCVMYGIRFLEFVETIGITEVQLGSETMPSELASESSSQTTHATVNKRGSSEILDHLTAIFSNVPSFFQNSIPDLSDIRQPALEDFFWIGGQTTPLHPSLARGMLAIVNRRRKKPIHHRLGSVWEQPIYLLLLRDGSYLCACCSLEDTTLIVHPYPQQAGEALQLRDQKDAEVIGQIVVVVRTLE